MVITTLHEYMGIKRLKKSEVVRMTGLARNTIVEIYNGNSKQLHLETIDKLIKGLGCDINDLLKYIPDDEGEKNV